MPKHIPLRLVTAALLATLVAVSPLRAAPPWQSLLPFKRSIDPNQSFELTEEHGPWLIMCSSFAGTPEGEKQAKELAIELRQEFGLKAYLFKQTFDYSQPEYGLGLTPRGERKKMKPRNAAKFDEIAVLVGDFQSVNDPAVENTLKRIKYCRPACFEGNPLKDNAQRFGGLRHLYRLVNEDPEKKTKGPLGAAFVTRNPLLPEELFVAKGLDPFVVEMNKNLEYSLLKCPGRYTVKVATFRGVDTLAPDEFEQLTSKRQKLAKIDEAAIKATKLCAALRKQGVEAYEFHDRTESIVCVGSFNSVGEPRPDGKQEINPAVYRVMQAYGPIKSPVPGQGVAVLQPRSLENILFDSQPLPVEVPRESIATAYNR